MESGKMTLGDDWEDFRSKVVDKTPPEAIRHAEFTRLVFYAGALSALDRLLHAPVEQWPRLVRQQMSEIDQYTREARRLAGHAAAGTSTDAPSRAAGTGDKLAL